jgi:alkylresorcinol/alkylpyrone synthase
MYLDNDPGVIISACLFGDGAGAAVLSREPADGVRSVRWTDSASLLDPQQRDALRFEQRQGMLRNILTRAVPGLAATYAHRVLGTVLERAGLRTADVSGWILHAGGRDVLHAIEQRFGVDAHALRYSAAMLREYGNLSSAFVYFVLDAALADAAPGGWWWLSSFGAGFSCHGALLHVK